MAEHVPHRTTTCPTSPYGRIYSCPAFYHYSLSHDGYRSLWGTTCDGPGRAGWRFNQSMGPWERTGAAPQGWASHLHQSVLPVQGYIQLRPQDTNFPPLAVALVCLHVLVVSLLIQCLWLLCRAGKASPSVSIVARAPVCPDTCRYCRRKPCDVKCQRCLTSFFIYTALGDRQCFHARSALR